MKIRILIIGITIIISILIIRGCRSAGAWLIKADNVVHADAIVILIGPVADRVLQAVDLYSQKMAGKIIFMNASSEAYRQLDLRGFHLPSTSENIKDALIALGIPRDSIFILDGNVLSTQDEAIILCKYLRPRSDVDTLLLVSSASHTRRASMIFETAFKQSQITVKAFCIPSKYSKYNTESWWKNKETIQTVMLEYLKLANFVFFEKRKLNCLNVN